MEDTLLRIPVECPTCGRELLTKVSIAALGEALARGSPIPLYTECHNQSWQASSIEREQLRQYFEAAVPSGWAGSRL
jgi:hypothetical protein